jgi:hypothetical protein
MVSAAVTHDRASRDAFAGKRTRTGAPARAVIHTGARDRPGTHRDRAATGDIAQVTATCTHTQKPRPERKEAAMDTYRLHIRSDEFQYEQEVRAAAVDKGRWSDSLLVRRDSPIVMGSRMNSRRIDTSAHPVLCCHRPSAQASSGSCIGEGTDREHAAASSGSDGELHAREVF